MGKKYIIELEDENYHQYSDSEPSDYLWRVKGFNALVFDEVGISKLTPYTEPDLEQVKKETYDEGYADAKGGYENGFENGMIVAWDAARKIGCYEIDGGYPTVQMLDLFDRDDLPKILSDYTASEAIEKLRAYEQEQEEQKEKDSVAVEDVMRQYLDTFCKGKWCTECPLYTPDFTCGRGHHFLSSSRISDEEVRRAYEKVVKEK